MSLDNKILAFSPELKVSIQKVISREEDGTRLTLEPSEEENTKKGKLLAEEYYFIREDENEARNLVKGLEPQDKILVVRLNQELFAFYGPLNSRNFYFRVDKNH